MDEFKISLCVSVDHSSQSLFKCRECRGLTLQNKKWEGQILSSPFYIIHILS